MKKNFNEESNVKPLNEKRLQRRVKRETLKWKETLTTSQARNPQMKRDFNEELSVKPSFDI